jgi:HK97 family phage major capsid protein
VKKLYKVLKAFGGHAENATLEFDADDAATKGMVAAGFIEEAPATVAEGLVAESLSKFEKSVSEVVNAASAKLDTAAKAISKGPRVEVVQDEADKTKSLADFFQCVGIAGILHESRRNLACERLEKVYGSSLRTDFAERFAKAESQRLGISMKAALAESSGITGGYTVPVQYATDALLSVEPEDTVLVGKTMEFPLAGREIVFPVLDQTTAPTAGNTAYFGGVVATWTAEGATRPETEPKFKELRLVSNELSGYALASRNIVMDNAAALELWLTKLFRGAIGWYRDMAYLTGGGVGTPTGITKAACTLSVTRATSNQVNYADVVNMYGKLLPQCVKNAFWVMQQSVLQSFLQMKDASNRLIIQPYFPGAQGGPAAVRPVMTLLGLPILTTEKVSTLGTKGDVLLVDPTFYFTATRQDVEIAASEHYKFLNNQITYRFLFRGDGKPWMDAPITLQDATTQVSPFVVLN